MKSDESKRPLINNRAKVSLSVVIIVLVAFLCETFLFNFEHWTTTTLAPKDAICTASVTEVANNDEYGGLKSGTHYVRKVYSVSDPSVSTIAVGLSGVEKSGDTYGMRIDIKDSGWSQRTYMIDSAKVSSGSKEIVTKVEPYGALKEIVVTAWSNRDSNIDISNVSINKPVPFGFSKVRFVLLLVGLFSIYLLRPSSMLWHRKHADCPLIAFGALAVMICLMSCFFMWHEDDARANWGTADAGARDEYAMLARSIVNDGVFYLAEEPPEYLSEMKNLDDGDSRIASERNIYDPTARDSAYEEANAGGGMDNIDKYKLDSAYFNGKYYVYFGIVPCLVAYVPFYLVTGADLSNTVAIYPALLVFAIFSALIIDLLARRKYHNASVASVCIGIIAVLLGSCVVQSISTPMFYNVPVMFALGFLTMGTYFLLRAHYSTNSAFTVVQSSIGAFFLVLTLGCRPQIAIGAIIIGITYMIFVLRSDKSLRTRISSIVALIILVLIIVAGILAYNYMRFGSFIDFGSNYNLTGNDMTLRGHSCERALESFVWYIFGVPHFSTTYPFIDTSFVPILGYGIKTVAEDFTGGLVFMAPFAICIVAAVFSKRVSLFVRNASLIALVVACCLAVFDAEGAGILVRYLQDFGYLIGFAMALILLDISRSAVNEYDMNKSDLNPQRECIMEIALRDNDRYDEQECFPSAFEYSVVVLVALSAIISLIVWVAIVSGHILPGSDYLWGYDQIRQIFDIFGPKIL